MSHYDASGLAILRADRARRWIERVTGSVVLLMVTYFGAALIVRREYGFAYWTGGLVRSAESWTGLWQLEGVMRSVAFPGANALYWASEFAVAYGLVLVLLVFRREFAWSFWCALVVTNVVGCVFFVLVPMAPPWALLHLYGPGLRSAGNAVGAFPSIHQADAVLVGRYVRAAFRRRWVGVLAWSWELGIAVDVVVTGNHYLLDVVAGGLVGYGVCQYQVRKGGALCVY